MTKKEKLERKETAKKALIDYFGVNEETIIYTIIIKASNGNFLVSSYIVVDSKIIRISHLIASILDLKLNKDQEYWTGRQGVPPCFGVAHYLGIELVGKALPYQSM